MGFAYIYMNMTDRLAWAISVMGAIGCIAVGTALYRAGQPVTIWISAGGSVASFVGLLIVAVQLVGVRRATSAAAAAATEARDSIGAMLALADVTRTIKLIEQVQNDVGNAKYDIARVRLQDVRANLIQFQPSIEGLGNEDAEVFERLLANTGVDLANLYNAVHGMGKPLNAGKLARGLEELIAILLKAERHLKLEG